MRYSQLRDFCPGRFRAVISRRQTRSWRRKVQAFLRFLDEKKLFELVIVGSSRHHSGDHVVRVGHWVVGRLLGGAPRGCLVCIPILSGQLQPYMACMVAWSLEVVQINLNNTHLNLTRLTYTLCKPRPAPKDLHTVVYKPPLIDCPQLCFPDIAPDQPPPAVDILFCLARV